MSIELTVYESREQWAENRKKGLGGSDASAVIGANPYKSNVDLWKEKTGRIKATDISGKPYVKYGTQAECYLRELFKLDFPQFYVLYQENNSFVNSKYPFARVSLDGWIIDENGNHGILEIKTTEIKQGSQRLKWKDRIPDNYYCQILFYMGVMEADFAILKAQIKTVIDDDVRLETKHYRIDREEVETDIEYLMSACRDFWRYVETDTEPPLILPEI